MKYWKKRISKWLLALLATFMVLLPLIGCNGVDVDQALDVAIEVLEVVEAIETETVTETAAETENVADIAISSIQEDGH